MADRIHTSDNNPETVFSSSPAEERFPAGEQLPTRGHFPTGERLPTEEEYLRAALDGTDSGTVPSAELDRTEPARTEPGGTELNGTEPGGTDPAKPAQSGPDKGHSVRLKGIRLKRPGQRAQKAQDAPSGDGPARPKLSAAARKKRRLAIRIAVAAMIVLLASFFLWRHFFGTGGKDSTEVLTDTVQIGSIMSTVEGSGMTRAKNSETVLIPFAGTVKEVLVEEGDTVSAGDPLFIVDSEDARKAVEDAEKGVERANEAVSKAEDAVQTARDRVREAETGVTTARDRVREAETGVATAQDRVLDAQDGVAAAQKRVDTAVKNLDEITVKRENLDIRAEYDGKLLDVKKLAPGDSVSEGTVVATLADDTRMRLTLYFSYAYGSDLREGQAVTVSVPRLMSEIPGTVEKVLLVERITEEGSRLFAAEIVAENEGGLAEGMEATAFASIGGEEVYPYEPGKLEYYQKREVKAEVAGKVVSTILEDYLPVEAGTVLLTLDEEDLNEKISEAEKAVEDAEKDVETARNRVTDAEKGVEDARKNVTDAEKGVETARKNVTDMEKGVEDAQKNVEEEKKGVEEAEKKLEEARENLAKCSGTAGIDGKVIGLDLAPGQEIAAGKAAMAISDISTLVVNATVDERNIGYVKKGMEVELDQYGNAGAIGVVESVSLSSSVNNGVATYPMVIAVDNTDESINVNSGINYKVTASQSENCLLVPIQCVRTVTGEDGSNKTVVYVKANLAPEGALQDVSVDEEIPDGFWPVEVQTGIQDTYNVEILSGLEEGWEVFTQIQSDSMW